MQLEQAVNAPLKVEIKGKEYLITEYSLYDFAVFKRRIQNQKLKLLNVIDDPDMRMKMMDKVMDGKITDEEVSVAMSSIEGISFLLWCMLKPNQPNIEFEEAARMIDSDNMSEVMTWITKLSPYKLKKKVKAEKD